MAALFTGLPPHEQEPATPKGKRKSAGDKEQESTVKLPRLDRNLLLDDIKAEKSSWLAKAAARFGLKGAVNNGLTDAEWKEYYAIRCSLELAEAANLDGTIGVEENDDREYHDEVPSTFKDCTWPEELGEKPDLQGLMCFEGHKEPFEESEYAGDVLLQVRKSVAATLASSALKLDPKVFARGVFITEYHINDADEGAPRTVEAEAIMHSPNASGNYIVVSYENHNRVRMSFTERYSYMYATKKGPGVEQVEKPGRSLPSRRRLGHQKIFDLDYNECRRKNPTKTSIATKATLDDLAAHLFGSETAISNRKMFGLLVRAVGLGKFGDSNGWPIAIARRRWKCGEDETETDTERISGDRDINANIGDCCVM